MVKAKKSSGLIGGPDTYDPPPGSATVLPTGLKYINWILADGSL